MSEGRYRALNTLLFIGTAFVVVVAVTLEPNPEGVGTHLQLGLGACIMLDHSTLPCPACGWTTSFALVGDARLIDAMVNQPFGAFLALITIAVMVIAGSEAIKPRYSWSLLQARFKGRETQGLGILFLVLFVSWAYKIVQKVIFLSSLP